MGSRLVENMWLHILAFAPSGHFITCHACLWETHHYSITLRTSKQVKAKKRRLDKKIIVFLIIGIFDPKMVTRSFFSSRQTILANCTVGQNALKCDTFRNFCIAQCLDFHGLRFIVPFETKYLMEMVVKARKSRLFPVRLLLTLKFLIYIYSEWFFNATSMTPYQDLRPASRTSMSPLFASQ